MCKGLSLNDSYWVVPNGFCGNFADYNLYENRFSEMLALVAYTGDGGSRRAFSTSPELVALAAKEKSKTGQKSALNRTEVNFDKGI